MSLCANSSANARCHVDRGHAAPAAEASAVDNPVRRSLPCAATSKWSAGERRGTRASDGSVGGDGAHRRFVEDALEVLEMLVGGEYPVRGESAIRAVVLVDRLVEYLGGFGQTSQ